ncbi:GAF and ANTAR domain-containing protein [Rhodococcus sp. 66b]|uniref:GAF and ANTAR domain-containing protein n=1 Tax=Rhodococcus sp. 66b TaxID=1945511 RepID=UPI0009BA2621|nr:GAF and ANTAR domain-containing protein [Rhodococcus sp. 66b]OQM78781.1 hypothetical protein B0E55_05237 [Rhodococcus sp. 66b]
MPNLPARRVQAPPQPFDVTKRLSDELVQCTGVDGAGVAVFASASTRDLVYATDTVSEELDEIQFTLGEGPCLDAFRFQHSELHDDIASGEARNRWPIFSSQVLALGAASVYAYPLTIGGEPFGVLEMYGRSPVSLASTDDATCRLYAESIGHAVLAELDPAYALISGTDLKVFRRGNVHVASGMLAARLGVPVEEALVRLRSAAFSQHRRITAVALEIVRGERLDLDSSRHTGIRGDT